MSLHSSGNQETFSGTVGNRMEILELKDHPFFFGTQFHPEYKSRPGQPSPPFVGLVEAVLEQNRKVAVGDTQA